VLQIGVLVFCTGSSVPNPVPINVLFSSTSSSNQSSYSREFQQELSPPPKKSSHETSLYFPPEKASFTCLQNLAFLRCQMITTFIRTIDIHFNCRETRLSKQEEEEPMGDISNVFLHFFQPSQDSKLMSIDIDN
jgi:hypothetical protein